MKKHLLKKLGIEGESLYSQSRIISSLLFLLPFTVTAYIFYKNGVLEHLSFPQMIIFALILLLALTGNILLRRVFKKFAMVSVVIKKVDDGEKVILDEHKGTLELLEISKSFNNLIKKLEDTGSQIEKLNLELNKAHVDLDRAEEALIPLKRVLDIMQLGVTIADPLRKILYTNLADARMHGYEVDELIGTGRP